MKEKLVNYLRACYPGIAIQTAEEQRAIDDVVNAARETSKGVVTWSATEGMRYLVPTVQSIPKTDDLFLACKERRENTVYIMRDIAGWPFDRDPILTRAFRDLLTWAPAKGSCIIIIAPAYRPHATFEKLVVVLDYTLPGKEDLKRIAVGITESAIGKIIEPDAVPPEVVRALSGLSTTEAENALSLSYVETGVMDAAVIYREKVQGVKKSGLLEIVDPDPKGMDNIGGLTALKEWAIKRRRAYTPEAEAFGLTPPKGTLLVGVPGSGKSLMAKAIGTALGVPTVKLDIGALFNSLVGESEARTREALKLAEAMAPCCLWVDEIDKGLAGASGSGSNDSGVTKRVFGTIISWMQERRRPVFLVATANDVTSLPPELLRKGRFDEIWAVDLPNEDERRAILVIHLVKRNRKKLIELKPVVEATDGFTGAEIEQVIEEAMVEAFDTGTDVTPALLVAAARATTPLSVTAKEKIEGIRAWANNRARWASAKGRTAVDESAPVRRVQTRTLNT